MLRKTLLSVTLAAASVGALVQTAAAEDVYHVQATNLTTLETKVYKPAQGMSYTIGSNRFIGYFDNTDGNCALTLMLFERASPDGTPDMSAARVQVSIRPGENTRIDSAEGEAIELSCKGKTVTAAHFDRNTQSQ